MQIVKFPTRKDVILDFVLTNLNDHYVAPEIFPPVGLSDHNIIMASPKVTTKNLNTWKVIYKRDSRASCKAAIGRYLSALDWPLLFNCIQSCKELWNTFQQVISIGLDLLMLLRKIRAIPSGVPWMSQKLKALIETRHVAFSKGRTSSVQFECYRNAVNRERKECRANYCESRVRQMKGEHPKAWWKEVKRLSGMLSRSCDMLRKLDVAELQDRAAEEIANTIDKEFLEPLEKYRLTCPLTPLPLEDCPKFLEVTEERTYKLLSRLNPAKANGPDGLPNWLLRDFASLVAFPVKAILIASFSEQRLPSSWSYADL